MRNLWILVLVLALAGCGVEMVATTAIEGAAQAENAKTMMNQAGAATGQLDRVKIERALASFHVERGVYPASLGELVPDFLPILPVKSDGSPYTFDPASGKVSP